MYIYGYSAQITFSNGIIVDFDVDECYPYIYDGVRLTNISGIYTYIYIYIYIYIYMGLMEIPLLTCMYVCMYVCVNRSRWMG